jgi:L-alanine-DL-glutamate epimerase-like enolase superfamily enzyme
MALRIGYCPFRLLFRYPFTTSHGMRDGTDSIFIRLEEDGVAGYGEVTLPPYLKEKPEEVIDRLRQVVALGVQSGSELLAMLDDPKIFDKTSPGCRAGLHTALIDLFGKKRQIPANEILDIHPSNHALTLMTVGITPVTELGQRLRELPASGALKVKVGHAGSGEMLRRIMELDDRPLFLDANQGLTSLAEAMELVSIMGDRLLALEQPFAVGQTEMQRNLQARIGSCVFGDESIQEEAGLERSVGIFKGVNIKLMKCGGLDRAKAMADRAAKLGMQTMLGSMSESSLGCTAMAHLTGQAEIVDLDGPWLIKNDPFEGIGLKEGKIAMSGRPGIGAVIRAELEFSSICA